MRWGDSIAGRGMGSGLFAFSLAVYLVFSYGGIRSPDSEVVYRTAAALARHHTAAVSGELPWKGFGLPHGVDGRRYSLFGPLESVLSVPLVWLADSIADTDWGRRYRSIVPVSHYVGDGLQRFVRGMPPEDPVPHVRRMVAFLWSPLLCALGVWLLYALICRMTGDRFAAAGTALLFGFGTLWFPYAGTFFSEPLATLLCLASLAWLVPEQPDMPPGTGWPVVAGLLMGLAVTAHITAILFLPFFAAFAGRLAGAWFRRSRWADVSRFLAGASGPLLVLGWYNWIRFGSVWETGRTVAGEMAYGVFVAPWHGLFGLLLSPGKGLLLFCPLVLVSVVAWPRFHRAYRSLSVWLGAAVLVRILFLACRSDWHGGFSIGPRYLVMVLPFLMLPIGVSWAEWRRNGYRWATRFLFAGGALAVWEQVRFSVGEIFSYLHILKWSAARAGIDVFAADRLYMDWGRSPILYLMAGRRGPWLLRFVPLSNEVVAMIATMLLLAGVAVLLAWTGSRAHARGEEGRP